MSITNEVDYKIMLNEIQKFALLFPEEIMFLFRQACEAVEEKKEGIIVDIGTFKGGSAICLALGVQAAQGTETIYTIDRFEQNSLFPETHLWGTNGHVYKAFQKNIEKFKVANMIQSVIADCYDVAKDWQKPIKLLFYDGSVMYENVKLDIEAWHPFIVEEGLMIFHDYSDYQMYNGNLKKAVDEFVSENKEFKVINRFGETVVLKRYKKHKLF